MSLFVLDSDILSLLQSGNATIAARVTKCAPGEVAITVISLDEQLRGWYTRIRNAKNPQQLAHGYERLACTVSDLAGTRILSYTEIAIAAFEHLRKAKLRIGSNDLRIAAIVLENSGTLVYAKCLYLSTEIAFLVFWFQSCYIY